MKKLALFLLISTFATFGNALAQSDGKYERKQKNVDFFIPEKELNRREVLPKFGEKKTERGVETPSEAARSQDMRKGTDALKQELNDIAKGKDKPLPPQKAGNRNSKYWIADNNFSNSPEYQKKYDDYLSDLKTIAKTGKAPINEALDRDLMAMSSEGRFLVETKPGTGN